MCLCNINPLFKAEAAPILFNCIFNENPKIAFKFLVHFINLGALKFIF